MVSDAGVVRLSGNISLVYCTIGIALAPLTAPLTSPLPRAFMTPPMTPRYEGADGKKGVCGN
jgi:hypothetical protein